MSETNYETLTELLDHVTIDAPQTVELRHLLSLNGNTRRGRFVNAGINEALRTRGLVVEPELDRADYWGTVTVSDRRATTRTVHQVGLPISKIADDAPALTCVGLDDTLERIETLMLMTDFSQIPVMDKHSRNLHGTVTWRSIARSRATGSTDVKARDVMSIGGHVADSSDNLMDLIPVIIEREFIYYKNPSGVIVGIVTASDLAGTFKNSTGPFIRIGEIETRLRVILDRLPVPDLESCTDPNLRRDDFAGASDMTFGEYIRVLENPKHWKNLSLGLDRSTCIENLKKINDIRNDIMHFRAARDEETDTAVAYCLNWLNAAESAGRD
ncbi:CBS domain-containing protein [Microbacterium sp. A84]|uniref:CBS domain-containing protein n=1 Tax=Microbacterium sp. A84 TaxID=3450715 RepID=UPI003F4248F1